MNAIAITSLHQKLIYSLAYNFFGNSEQARYIVRETCQRWDGFPEKANQHPRTILIRIAANLCMDVGRDTKHGR